MKKILIVLQSIGYGGSMTSLINLLGFLKDEKELDIDVQFMDRYGELLGEAEKVAHVLPEDKLLQAVTMRRSKITAMKRFDLYISRGLWAVKGKVTGSSTAIAAYQKAAQTYSNNYDCVIAFQEGVATNFVRYIASPCKIAWIHTEYDRLVKLYPDMSVIKDVYSAFDKIVCVSKTCEKHISDDITGNVSCIYNTIPTAVIGEKATVSLIELLDVDIYSQLLDALERRQWKFISSGRFSKEKRFDRLVAVAELLKMANVDFAWLVLGQGEEFSKIQNLIIEKQLEEYVYLLGAVKNPFPFVKACDLFVLTSDYEAQPMVANEALILGLPVITTDYESAREVVEHGKNGLICNMTAENIFQSILTIIEDDSVFKNLLSGANQFVYRNDEIVEKVIQLFLGGEMPKR